MIYSTFFDKMLCRHFLENRRGEDGTEKNHKALNYKAGFYKASEDRYNIFKENLLSE